MWTFCRVFQLTIAVSCPPYTFYGLCRLPIHDAAAGLVARVDHGVGHDDVLAAAHGKHNHIGNVLGRERLDVSAVCQRMIRGEARGGRGAKKRKG